MHAPSRILVSLLAVLVSIGCADFQITSQEIRSRHDAESDACELLILSFGLHPLDVADETRPEDHEGLFVGVGPKTPEAALERALEGFAPYAAGDRRFMTPYVPFELDVDDVVEEGPEQDRPIEERAVDLLASLDVVGAGAFEHDGGLALWQHVRVPRVGEWIDWINAAWSHSVLQDLEENVPAGDLEAEIERVMTYGDGLLDRRSAELWIARARSDDPWVTFDGERLRFDLPLTRAVALEHGERAFEEAAKLELRSGSPLAAMLIVSIGRHTEALSIEDERTTLELAADEDDHWVLRTGGQLIRADRALLDAWIDGGHELARDVDLDALRARLDE